MRVGQQAWFWRRGKAGTCPARVPLSGQSPSPLRGTGAQHGESAPGLPHHSLTPSYGKELAIQSRLAAELALPVQGG